jgi:hypothetical protein
VGDSMTFDGILVLLRVFRGSAGSPLLSGCLNLSLPALPLPRVLRLCGSRERCGRKETGSCGFCHC